MKPGKTLLFLDEIQACPPALAKRIASLRQIVDFRNHISHGYDTVDDEVVWGVIEKHLPLLKKTCHPGFIIFCHRVFRA